MSGITVIEGASNIAATTNSWSTFLQTAKDWSTGNASASDMVKAGASFVAAASSLKTSGYGPAFSGIAGLTTGLANWSTDQKSYADAVNSGDVGAQNQALSSLVGDAAGVGQGISVGLNSIATSAGAQGLAAAAASMGTGATVIGGVAGVVGISYSVGNWLQNYLNSLDDALTRGATEWNNMMLDLGAFNQNGQSLIIMAGQPGDSLTSTPLSGGGFTYTEADSSGVQNGSVTLAMNGATETETLTGLNTVSDVSGFRINLSGSTTAKVDGSNNGIVEATGDYLVANGGANLISAAAGSQTYITGTNSNLDTVNANGVQFGGTTANGQPTGILFGVNAAANIIGSNNGIAEAIGDYVVANGGGNLINAAAGSQTYITGTNGNLDMVNANGVQLGGTTANGQPTGILFGVNAAANIIGSNNGIAEAIGDYVVANGGGNLINAAAGSQTYITGTNANLDTVNANGVQLGGTTANDQPTGILFGVNAAATIIGSNNGIAEAVGDYIVANGGGNLINAAAGSQTYITGTNSSFDTVNANGVQLGGVTANGQPTGILFNTNSQANVNGNGNGIYEAAGDSVGIYGGANIINASTGTLTVIGKTGSAFDTINATGDLFGGTTANGQGTGIWMEGDSQAVVNGNGNAVNMSSGCTLTATGNSDIVNMVAGAVVNVSGTGDDLNGSGALVDINGNNQSVWLSGENNTITVTGVNVTVFAQNSRVFFIGAAANNDSDRLVGSGNSGTGWTSADAWRALIGTPHTIGAPPPFQIPTFTDPGATVPGGATLPNPPVYVPWIPSEIDPNVGVPIQVTAPPCPDGIDPIILNLNGNEVQTTALAGSSTYFDMLNNGQKVQTAWGTAGEGYLVYDPNDPNNTTVITQDSQMVGGFGALQSLAQQADGTGHGTLTQADALWHNLKVWVDTTGSGQFQSGQLMSLDQLGITSLNLDGTTVNRNSNGNHILVDSTFTRADGRTGDVAGVSLMNNPNVTANPVESQVRNLIAAMSSFAAPAGSSAVPLSVHQDAFAALAANLH